MLRCEISPTRRRTRRRRRGPRRPGSLGAGEAAEPHEQGRRVALDGELPGQDLLGGRVQRDRGEQPMGLDRLSQPALRTACTAPAGSPPAVASDCRPSSFPPAPAGAAGARPRAHLGMRHRSLADGFLSTNRVSLRRQTMLRGSSPPVQSRSGSRPMSAARRCETAVAEPIVTTRTAPRTKTDRTQPPAGSRPTTSSS